MNDKQTILSSIHLGRTKRPPVMILSGGVWANKQISLSLQDSFDLPPWENAQNIIRMNEKLRSDLVWAAAGCNNLALRAIGAKVTFNEAGVAARVEEALITCAEDVDRLNVDDLENDPGIISSLETTRILKEEIGQETLIGISQWGPTTLASLLLGTKPFILMSVRNKEAVEHVLDFTEKLVVKYWKLFVQAGVELVSQAEPSASYDMISPKQFAGMARPHMQNANRAVDGLVQAKMLHICGNINKLLELLPETGSDVISFDYYVDLKFARETLGGKMAFAGKLDPVGTILNGTPDLVRELTLKGIEEAGGEGGYIVMPGCDIPPASPLGNIQAMTETARSYRY